MSDSALDDLRQPQNEKRKSSFMKRLLSGAALLLLAFLFIPLGGLPLFLLTLALSLLGLFELYRAFSLERTALGGLGCLALLLSYLLLYLGREELLLMLLILSLMAMLSLYVLSYPKYHIDSVSECFFGLVYAGLMMSYLYLTRMLPDGKILSWLILLSSWGTDTFAYCAGMLFGRTKMTPVLSPKKTVEGAIGGVIGASALGFFYALLFRRYFTAVERPEIISAVSSAAASLISMAGDLAASGIKRDRGIKDYGRLIPGHGGILDRFDSMLFTAPTVYYALRFLSF